MADTYTVTGALAIVATDVGESYVYRGGKVPAGITDHARKHLLDLGLIAKDSQAAGPEPDTSDDEQTGEQAGKVDLDEMNLAELRDYAKDNDIDLHGATKKDEVLAEIKSAY